MTRIAVIDSGVANLASVMSALEAVGARPFIAASPIVLDDATHIVLPGVGSFGQAARTLRDRGFDTAIRYAAARGLPLLGICLGMQLLAEGSDEAPGESGLGIYPGTFERLPDRVAVPHLGWNGVEALEPGPLLASGTAAFANSFCLRQAPAGWNVATTTHGTSFVSALHRDRILLCQFHPELSGSFGLDLLHRWVIGSSDTAFSTTEPCADLALRIIPCLDVRNGEVVKGVKFQNLRRAGDPAERAAQYETDGADEIVLLDVGAAPEKRETQIDTVRAVRDQLHIPLTIGGGVRSVGDARQLLAAGADKISINSAAVRRPALLDELAEAFGSQCVVLAIDARRTNGSWENLVIGGRESSGRDAVAWAAEAVERGAGEILLTSWDRDGTREGCDLDLLRAVSQRVTVPVIASGGIGSRSDALDAWRSGASAVLAASIFHDDEDTPAGVKSFLAKKGITVRQ
jgi:imidazole glycerol phosphate synthase glutamine amidotransferase subunit